ncbi:MAG: anthranilate phosphoribosyltransferase [Hydrogenibacillus sp.]|nr:anthranilate phosphoribosyltransferase [Hydrogenibacillus sp.]
MRDILKKLARGETLSQSAARSAMEALIGGEAHDVEIAAFFGLLRGRGETHEEIAGFAQGLRAYARAVRAPEEAIDTAGTGGDGGRTYNVSTAAALVAAAAGVPVVKHGNRAVSGRSGSADVLGALGVPTELGPEAAEAVLAREGFVFLFAPLYHPALSRVQPVRRALGIPTVMNVLGPLVNPARVKRQVVGVADRRYQLAVARALQRVGVTRALVVSSADGLDEISVSAPTRAVEIDGETLKTYDLTPEALGLPLFPGGSYASGTPEDSARVIEQMLTPTPDAGGAKMNADYALLLANAAAALYVGGKAASLRDGVRLAEETIESGRVLDLLARLKRTADGVGRSTVTAHDA